MGALEAPQDRHGQEHRTGTSRAEQTKEAMAELGAQEAMAELGALEAMAELGAQEAMADRLRAVASVPSARPLQPDKQDKTGAPTGTGSPPGLAWKLRLLLGMTSHQGPSQGSLSYRFHIRDKGAGGWEWPPRP